jgi:hypothetical protein
MADMVDKLFRIHARKHGLDFGERMADPGAKSPGTAAGEGAPPMRAEWVRNKAAAEGSAKDGDRASEWPSAHERPPVPDLKAARTPAGKKEGNPISGKPRSKKDSAQLGLFDA